MKLDLQSKLFVALSAVGIVDAIYHSYDELTATFTTCTINNILNCRSVFESGYTTVFGIPFYILGLVWFPLCLVLGLSVIRREGTPSAYILVPFLMIGNIFTLYLWYLDIFIIAAYCPVCVSLYVINYALMGVSLSSRQAAAPPNA